METWKEMLTKKFAIEQKLQKNFTYDQIFKIFCLKRPYKLLRVTAVLTAKDDGTQALGEVVNGKARPIAPHLRNPQKHLNPDDNYVKDWIILTNQQLLKSGANFGLDLENLKYTFEKNTLLNTIECWSSEDSAQQVKSFFSQKAADSSPNNPYRDSVLILFRWGSNSNAPAGQSCAGVDAPYIISNRYDEVPIKIDGVLRGLSNNQLTHEFGHFMGLSHPFINIANDIAGISNLGGRNPDALPLIEANLSMMPGVTAADLAKAKEDTLKLIREWPYNYDQDIFGGRHPPTPPPEIPDTLGVMDTPIDLGVGFPLVFGYTACSGTWKIPVQFFDGSTQEINVNDSIRKNVMSYWRCDNSNQRFSSDQVKRMSWVLDNVRSNLIGRTIMIKEICKPIILEELYKILPEFIPIPDPGPEPDWKQIIDRLPQDMRRNNRLTNEIKTITATIPIYRPWNKKRLETYYRDLDQRGVFRRIQPGTDVSCINCQPIKPRV